VAALLGRGTRSGGLSPYAAPVDPVRQAPPAGSMPPVPALAAAALALMSAMVPALFGLLALAFSGGQFGGTGWLVLAVPAVLVIALVIGAVRLLLGRSWLGLAVPAGALTAVLTVGYVMGGWGGGAFGVLTLVVPLATTVLAVLPRVRQWVAARRHARRAG
jgi:hypothetical protein